MGSFKSSVLILVLILAALSLVVAQGPRGHGMMHRQATPPEDIIDQQRAFFNAHVQCRLCTADFTSFPDPDGQTDYLPSVPMKWCLIPSTTNKDDFTGKCISASSTCDSTAVEIRSTSECPTDTASTKPSCSLCTLDAYTWCQDSSQQADEYLGYCTNTQSCSNNFSSATLPHQCANAINPYYAHPDDHQDHHHGRRGRIIFAIIFILVIILLGACFYRWLKRRSADMTPSMPLSAVRVAVPAGNGSIQAIPVSAGAPLSVTNSYQPLESPYVAEPIFTAQPQPPSQPSRSQPQRPQPQRPQQPSSFYPSLSSSAYPAQPVSPPSPASAPSPFPQFYSQNQNGYSRL